MPRNILIALMLLGLVAAPMFAFAQTGTSTAPRTGATLEARLERAKQKAAEEIDRRIAALNHLEERIAMMKRVSSQFKADLVSTVDIESAHLEALRTKIAASTDGEEIKADVQTITRTYRIFALVMPKVAIAAAADRIVTMTATLSEIGAKLKARVDAAAEDGEDVSVLNTSLTELAAHITSANDHAKKAVDGTATLMPDNGDKAKMDANKAALHAAREELKAAHDDVKAARELVRQIIDGLNNTASSTEESSTLDTETRVQV